jgi:hypothetical protein
MNLTTARQRSLLLYLGGLLIGLATSLPLAVGWPDAMHPQMGVCLFGTEANPMERIWIRGRIFPLPCMPTFLFAQPAVGGSLVGAGIVFGLLAYELAGRSPSSGRGARVLAAALGGSCLLILSYLGMLFVPRLSGLEPLFALPSSVAQPFALMAFGIASVFAFALGLALRTPGVVWRALVAAMATALAHGAVTWLLLDRAMTLQTHDPAALTLSHSLPALGNGMGRMMTTILISNLVGGTIGGCVTLWAVTGQRSPARERREGQRPVTEHGGVDV